MPSADCGVPEARGGERSAPWPIQWTDRLQSLTAHLSGLVDRAAVARAAVEHGQAALGAQAGVVFLLSPDGAFLEIGHASGFEPESVAPWMRFPLSAPLPAADAVRARETVVILSREDLARRYPALAATPGMRDRLAATATPLLVDGTCIGAFGLSFQEGQLLGTQELDFIRVVADQCAQALRRADLMEQERRSTQRLRALAQASRVFAATSPNVASVLNAVATEVLAHLAPSASIMLVSPDGACLFPTAIRDCDPERERRRRAVGQGVRLTRGEGISGRVLATGHTILIPWLAPGQAWKETTAPVAHILTELGVQSLLAVPIKAGGSILGVIAVARYGTDSPFTDDDRTLLEDLADRAALALENARLHEAERQARGRAEEADRRKDEFLAMLGHELRNPLAPIGAALGILRRLPSESERSRWAREAIGRQVAQLARLVDDLLDVSRINLGKIELRLEKVDLGAVALQALEACRPLLSERGHQVSVALPPGPARVKGDAVRLTQVISNLLNNAAKYTSPGGSVRLVVSTEGHEATVTVADSGAGIPAEMLGQVFDLFAQGPGARDPANGGLGVGLTLVKRLIELHGGTVRASSAGPGCGSDFMLRLPILPEVPALETHPASSPGPGQPPARRRILIADDNVDAAEGLRQLLELQEHEVQVVHDGAKALEVVTAFSPEVILLDIGLPSVDGLEVARRVRASTGDRRPLLVAVTGLGRSEDRRRSAEVGFDHHLVKPIDLASLEALLAGLGTSTAPPASGPSSRGP